MKKVEQEQRNAYVEKSFDVFRDVWYDTNQNCDIYKLRTCSATVYNTPDYIVLRSYNTIVAFINKNTREFFDILRYVYGYTSTSAQHIAKFRNDYSNYFDWSKVYTWYR